MADNKRLLTQAEIDDMNWRLADGGGAFPAPFQLQLATACQLQDAKTLRAIGARLEAILNALPIAAQVEQALPILQRAIANLKEGRCP